MSNILEKMTNIERILLNDSMEFFFLFSDLERMLDVTQHFPIYLSNEDGIILASISLM